MLLEFLLNLPNKNNALCQTFDNSTLGEVNSVVSNKTLKNIDLIATIPKLYKEWLTMLHALLQY